MKLLLDANLSWRLVKNFEDHFPNSLHISRTGLSAPAEDENIFAYAKENDFLIVTFDEDLLLLSFRFGFPPKVILLKTYSQTSIQIPTLLISHKEEIENFYYSEDVGILEIFS
jgi:predicted nuclease of predicted toxin-antitoxin system